MLTVSLLESPVYLESSVRVEMYATILVQSEDVLHLEKHTTLDFT